MTPSHRPLDRATALACDRALIGLDPAEELELASLMKPGVRLDARLELAAAAIVLSEITIDEPLPRNLAERAFAAASAPAAPAPMVARGGTIPMPGRPMPASEPRPEIRPSNVIPIAPRRQILPWLAAAACLVFAIGSLLVARSWKTPGPIAKTSSSPPAVAAAAARDRLVAEAKDLVRTAWSPTTDPAGQGETGEVVWSNAKQEGYMTFRAVQSNDPTKIQYQLWIFDAERDDRYPVDGGVFDVDASKGEVVIPIAARVAVGKPTLFAVTVERPGGVVVSKRERIVALAKVI